MINIGKYIRNFIVNDDTINSLINGQCSPLIAEDDVSSPFLVYYRSGMDEETTKSKGMDADMITIFVSSFNYTESITLSGNIIDLLTKQSGNSDDGVVYIESIKHTDSKEDYEIMDGTPIYVQILSFRIYNQKN